MITLPIYQVDAFASRLFGGNPAAVCPLAEWLPDDLMQQIAAENNLAETAFFVPQGRDFGIRWFTPELEVDLCGHATLATAHVILNELGWPESYLHFHSKSGLLKVHRKDQLLELDFPATPPQEAPAPAHLLEGLGARPVYLLRSKFDYLAVYATEAEVLALRPDFGQLGQVATRGIIVSAPGTNCDFVSRFFGPGAGINEDPVTGSAHCALVPYWAERLGKKRLHAWQLSKRRGELWCELAHDRVKMAGNTVLYLQGEIKVTL
ncbi:MAG: PhzF family phenazine biosynthesis protein [Bernardetiaceae bacterium]|jgi:PhzF family phenazine biosynthesis protein|nr:PhzF family phenazine biosynthesis protein [Bernardetiaceae bacterium]